MSTMTRESSRVKPKKSAPVVSLALAIDHVVYQVEPIPAGEFGSKAWRLSKKSNGDVYDVIRDNDGLVQCDCPSYEVTFKGTLGTCKHGTALVTLGLLDAPAYTRWPEPEDFTPSRPDVDRVRDEFDPAPEPAPAQEAQEAAQEATAEVKPNTATPAEDGATAIPGPSGAILAACWLCDGAGRIFDTDGLYPGTPEWSDCPICSPAPELEAAEPGPGPGPEAEACDGCGDLILEAEAEAHGVCESCWHGLGMPDGGGAWEPEADRQGLEPVELIEPAAPALTLAELVAVEAASYARWGTGAGDMLARVLGDLARKITFTGATTPEEFLDRADAADLVLALRA